MIAVAHIREEGSNNWWRFDDEMVTAMPKGPMDSVGDLGVAAEKKPLHESRAAGNSKVTLLNIVTCCSLCDVLCCMLMRSDLSQQSDSCSSLQTCGS